jgi:hypothetical protein
MLPKKDTSYGNTAQPIKAKQNNEEDRKQNWKKEKPE